MGIEADEHLPNISEYDLVFLLVSYAIWRLDMVRTEGGGDGGDEFIPMFLTSAQSGRVCGLLK
ncbi:hypothetical protein J2045_001985 [Peteryoungia aggregata LMG 23059]|uniref:Uncharacterized protein n=1 Tax=Peteryoungia aggregata LMG 23059 TaxID=1368425 RepID=A0ABU0G6N6_9HYPH|nr:hypothetical protein [Peteryoungia aggregata]MDQ0420958.1 hypothetical protein [Peteryoungia aggregata LMG 23059]